MVDLKTKTIAALKWSFAGVIGAQGMQFGVSVILARLLVPAEFGLIAMLGLFLAIAASIMDSGFGSALMQKQDASREDFSSVFYFNLALSSLGFAAVWFSAPWIAAFFSEPTLTPLARFMAINLIINAFGLIQGVALSKELDFKSQARVTIAASVISGTLGIALAYKGCGVWSLAAQSVASSLVRVFLLWRTSRWRPAPVFSFHSLKSMFPFGSRLLLSGLLNTTFEHIYQVIIGRIYSKTDLGLYTRATTTQKFPATIITSVLAQVAFPAFSTLQNDRERLHSAFRRAITLAAFVTFPVMLGLVAVAQPLFDLLFGSKWAACVPYFQVLCLGGMLLPLHSLNLSVLMAAGRSDLFLRLEIIKKVLILGAILVTWPFGIMAMVWGQCVSSIVCYGVNTYYSGTLINYPLAQQFRDLLPSLLLALGMAVIVYLAGKLISGGNFLKVSVQGMLGAALYLAGSTIFRMAPRDELRTILSGRWTSPREVVCE